MKKLLIIIGVALAIVLVFATDGNIMMLPIAVFGFGMAGLLIYALGSAVAEKLVGHEPSWKAIAVGVVIVICGLFLLGKGCPSTSSDDDFDVGRARF